MVALDGILLAKNVALAEDNFIQEVLDRDPDKEDYEGYMGNSGPDATHFYQDSVRNHTFKLSTRWLNLNPGRYPSAFLISQTFASTGGHPGECGHQHIDAGIILTSGGLMRHPLAVKTSMSFGSLPFIPKPQGNNHSGGIPTVLTISQH